MASNKLSVRRLETFTPPLAAPLVGGGRILTPMGELTQIWNGSPVRFLAYVEFLVNDATPRGNHFHAWREEHLYLVRGRVRVVHQDLDTDDRGELILEAGDLMTIGPRCAHVFFPLEYSQAIEFSSSDYDPEDTHKQVVVAVDGR